MDYAELLSAAQKNSEKQTDFLLRRKSNRNVRKGPNPKAVAAFKARREREERQRILRDIQEKNRLLSLRAQNSKSLKKAHMMKSRTRDNDFGKIVTKDEDRFLDEKIREQSIMDTKERMKARIQLEQQITNLNRKQKEKFLNKIDRDKPVKVQSTTSCQDKIQQLIRQSKSIDSPEKKNLASKRLPPPSYNELLDMAQKNAGQPKRTLEEEIKAEIEFNQQQLAQRKLGMTGMSRSLATRKEKDKPRQEQQQYYPTKSNKTTLPSNEQTQTTSKNHNKKPSSQLEQYQPESSTNSLRINQQDRYLKQNSLRSDLAQRKQTSSSNGPKIPNDKSLKTLSSISSGSRSSLSDLSSSKRTTPKVSLQAKSSIISTKKTSPQSVICSRTMNFDNSHLRVQQSSSNHNISNKKFQNDSQSSIGHEDMSRSRLPQPLVPPKPRPKLPPIGATYRRGMYNDYDVPSTTNYYAQPEDDDYYEDEEDDDMADFIDDGPLDEEPEEEYSKHIREIFGYDKRKYRNVIEDDIEEASYSQVMREEMRSLREGIKEDLEDIKREEQEKRLKLLQKKARMKGLKGY